MTMCMRDMTRNRLASRAWGPSCPKCMGTVLPQVHGDRLAPRAWGPSSPKCMGTVLPHVHGDRFAPSAWGPSCPTCMGTVLPQVHGDRLAPRAWGPSCPTCMGTVLPHVHYVCLNTAYTQHNIILPMLYCFNCQLINTIIMSPIKYMIHIVL